MGELLFELGQLFVAGAKLAAPREHAGRRLSRADDERAVGGEQLAVAGDELEAAAGRLRQPQARSPADRRARCGPAAAATSGTNSAAVSTKRSARPITPGSGRDRR